MDHPDNGTYLTPAKALAAMLEDLAYVDETGCVIDLSVPIVDRRQRTLNSYRLNCVPWATTQHGHEANFRRYTIDDWLAHPDRKTAEHLATRRQRNALRRMLALSKVR